MLAPCNSKGLVLHVRGEALQYARLPSSVLDDVWAADQIQPCATQQSRGGLGGPTGGTGFYTTERNLSTELGCAFISRHVSFFWGGSHTSSVSSHRRRPRARSVAGAGKLHTVHATDPDLGVALRAADPGLGTASLRIFSRGHDGTPDPQSRSPILRSFTVRDQKCAIALETTCKRVQQKV
eukprot:356139-Chlamydomonas_euryale.AAC.5